MSAGKVSRLAYFPKPYPDELLYSIVARYRRHMAVSSLYAINRDLFGNERQRPSFDLPNRVGELARRIPSEAGLTTSRLIRRHTLFPYYRAVSPLSRTRLALRDMTEDGQGGQGLAQVGPFIPRAKVLRFCSDCAAEMVDAYDEMYWRRDHQLPGTLACTKHRRPLLASTVKVGYDASRYEAATEMTCPPGAATVTPPLEPDELSIVLAVADAGTALLRGRSSPGRDDEAWRSHFLDLCRRKGIVIGRTHHSRRALTAPLTRALGFLEPVWPRMFEGGVCGKWTESLDAVTPQHVFDPVLRILAKEAIERMPDWGGWFGHGPWPCMNPLSGHFKERRISNVSAHSISGSWTGTFECDCGYAFTRSAFRDGRISPPRLRKYGPTLTKLIREAISQGCNVTVAARIAQIDVRQLRSLAEGEGFTEWARAPGDPRGNGEEGLWRSFHPGEEWPGRLPRTGKQPRSE